MTRRQTIKRFFEPTLLNKWEYAASLMVFVIWRLFDFGNVLFIKKIISSIEQKDQNLLKYYCIYLVVFVISYQVISFFWIRKFGFYQDKMRKFVYEKWFKKLAYLDNNALESYGT
jgi:ABC-type multidrug transport system fused ATPase/permease subunit